MNSAIPRPRAGCSRRSAIGGLLVISAGATLASSRAWAVGAGSGGIVALGGGITEILYALGCGERIVGVDLTSTYPSAAREKPNVGYYRRLSAEGVLGLAPSLVVAADGAGPRETVDVLQAASVRFLALKEVRRPADVIGRIRAVADAVGEGVSGRALADAVAADLATLAEDLRRIERRRRALILLGPARGGPMTAGGSDSTGELALELVGAENAAVAMSGWKPLSDEAAFGFAPEAVVVMVTGALVSAASVAETPALAHSPAARENRIVVADALGLVGFGPRVAHVAREVARRIYPEAEFSKLPARPWTAEGTAAR